MITRQQANLIISFSLAIMFVAVPVYVYVQNLEQFSVDVYAPLGLSIFMPATADFSNFLLAVSVIVSPLVLLAWYKLFKNTNSLIFLILGLFLPHIVNIILFFILAIILGF